MNELDSMGPIDYLVVEFPGFAPTGEAMPLLTGLVDSGTIRVLDLVFVTKDADGSVRRLSDQELAAIPQAADYTGASSGALNSEDVEDVVALMDPGNTAGILVYENAWAAPFASALRRNGGQLLASGRIQVQAMLAALDAAETR